jgi:TatD DNase family protein
MFIDSHAHIDTRPFDGDRDEVIARARQAGVETIIVIGATGDVADAERAVALAESRTDLYATVGIHPHDVAKMEPSWWPALRQLAARDKVVAIGETGLDYHYDHSPRDVQKRCFGQFIEMARELDLPVVCHVRDAHDDARRILADHGAGDGRVRAVIHCFTGDPGDAEAYAAMGLYVSFSGIVTFKGKSADPIREALRLVPRELLLIETDCPYLAPVPMRGRRNEPAFLVHTAEAVANELGLELAELAALTAENTRAAFALPGRRGPPLAP